MDKLSLYSKLMWIKIVIGQFFLISLTYSLCLNPAEPEGKCTSCHALSILIKGTCFAKIRGCLIQTNDICASCLTGYLLNKYMCIHDANLTNGSGIFASNIEPDLAQTLTYKNIINKLGQLYGNYFAAVDSYFKQKYLILENSTILSGNKLETQKGVFLMIQYSTVTGIKFLASAFVDNIINQISEWSFENQEKKKNDPITIDNQLRQILEDQIKNLQIYNFNKNEYYYIIDYINKRNDVLRVIVSINDIGMANLANKITTKSISFADLAIQQFLLEYPYYNNLNTSVTFQMHGALSVLKFGSLVSVSFQFNRSLFLFNKPYQSIFSLPTSNLSPKSIVGGFTILTNYSDQNFLNSFNEVEFFYPELTNAKITKVQFQIVAGISYIIDLEKPTANSTSMDIYQIRIWYTLQKTVILIQAIKNGAFIYTDNYDYNSDEDFLNNYVEVVSHSHLVDIPPIQSVLFNVTGNRKYYKVTYDDFVYAQIEYFTDTHKVDLLSYTVQGQNILVTLLLAQKTASQRSQNVLLSFLQSKQPISNTSFIQSINVNLPTYEITIITSNGQFKAVIVDNGGTLNLTSYTQLSNSTCYELPPRSIQDSQKIHSINDFLIANYPLLGFTRQLAQVKPAPNNFTYRFMYANSNQKQIQIYVSQVDGVPSVLKASYINFGYQTVDPLPSNSDYTKIVSLMKSANVTGNKIPIYTEVNDSIIKTYYNNEKSTIEFDYDKKTNKLSSQIIASRTYLLVPNGFDLSNLIFPGTSSASIRATLSKITQQAVKKYLTAVQNVAIIFATQVNTTFTILYKNSLGYQQLDATVDSSGAITIGKLIKTAYNDSSFSNCKQYNIKGKCLSCDTDTEEEYQGYCWNKMEGCLIQLGTLCVKCDLTHAKSNYKCYKECSSFFN